MVLRMGIEVNSGIELAFWVLIQQLWLIIGSYLAVKDCPIFHWNAMEIGWGILGGVGLFISTNLLNLIMVTVFGRLFGTTQVNSWLLQEQAGTTMLLGVENKAAFLLISFLLVVGAPLSEELLFRGALLYPLAQIIPKKWAVILTALCFALVHFYVIQFIPVLFSGVVLGLLFMANGSIVRSVTAHIIVNGFALLAYIL